MTRPSDPIAGGARMRMRTHANHAHPKMWGVRARHPAAQKRGAQSACTPYRGMRTPMRTANNQQAPAPGHNIQ